MDGFWQFGKGAMNVFGFGPGTERSRSAPATAGPAEFSFGSLETRDFRRIARRDRALRGAAHPGASRIAEASS